MNLKKSKQPKILVGVHLPVKLVEIMDKFCKENQCYKSELVEELLAGFFIGLARQAQEAKHIEEDEDKGEA